MIVRRRIFKLFADGVFVARRIIQMKKNTQIIIVFLRGQKEFGIRIIHSNGFNNLDELLQVKFHLLSLICEKWNFHEK